VSADIVSELNEQQKKAVCHREGPLLVLAGAGSGKTRVLTHRIAYLINEHGVDPRNILAVTFTNKAAEEMKERVNSLIGGLDRNLLVSTFHSFGVRILRKEINKIGFARNFVIYDTVDQKSMIKRIIKEEMEMDPKNLNPGAVTSEIARAKNELLTPDEYQNQITDFFRKNVKRVYELYQKQLQENNALDFGDLIMKTVELFAEHEAVCKYYQDRYRYLLIDEYQDINLAQYRLSQLLVAGHNNIFVVGDPDQSIYGFRGADIRNILNFEQDYPGAKTIKLEQNYRSQPKILQAAHSVIANNESRKEKELWTARNTGPDLKIKNAGTARSEADYVCRQINNLCDRDFNYGDIAVLFRTNAQSRLLEEAFMKYSIPYQMVSGTRFYERKEIKDLLAYLRVIYNKEDEMSLRRIINTPRRGIGPGTLEKLENYAAQDGLGLYRAGQNVKQCSTLSGAYEKRVADFFSLMDDLSSKKEDMHLLNLLDEILIRTGYRKKLRKKNTDTAHSRLENIEEFFNVIEDFVQTGEDNTLAGFLEEVALLSDVDDLEEGEPGVVLMTLHAAKGLEFPAVFITGMEEGIFPHANSLDDKEDMEEERRICYVGITRAEEELYLTRARERRRFGKSQRNDPSRFLRELPEEILADDRESMASYISRSLNSDDDSDTKKDTADSAQKSKNTGNSRYKVGDRVVHPRFGRGKITAVKNEHGLEVTVEFEKGKPRQLLAEYASLQKL